MNSFIENVNYIADLDNKYGRSAQLYKNNISLRNELHDIVLTLQYYNFSDKELHSVVFSYNDIAIDGLNNMLLNIKSQIIAIGFFTCDVSFNYTNFVINNVATINIEISSADDNIKLYSLNLNVSKDNSEIYDVNGIIKDSLKILPTLANMDKRITDRIILINDNIEDIQNASENAIIATNKALEASNSAISANNSATSALESKNSATNSSNISTTKASEALNSANIATTQAGIATSKASESSTSASSALSSANSAATKANEASASALNANNSATSASSYANSASISSTNASNSANTASTKANEASVSASSASTSAASALSSSNSASSSANTATQQANIATTKATEANTSANSASVSENKAEKWANELENVPVEPGKYSAMHWAIKAQEFSETIAEDISYNNTTSGLSAIDVQNAIDEIVINGTNIDATNIVSGTIDDARLPASISSDLTGNANTATKLYTARTISLSGDASGSATFDGSADATINVTIADDSHNHSFTNITGKPSTLAGYGITDADTSAQVTTKVSNAVAGLVASSPAALDTLNELAIALGNDANFATTTSTALGNRVIKNADIVAGTGTKITYDAKGLVTGSSALSQSDVTSVLGAGSITNTMIANTAVSNLSGTNTGDQTITLTGDVTGTGTGSFVTTLANSGVTAGTYGSASLIPTLTVDSKGRVTNVTTNSISVPSGSISVTGGDLTMSGNTGTAITNATLSNVGTAGTYTKVTTDSKGRVTSGTTLSASDIPTLNQNTTGSAGSVINSETIKFDTGTTEGIDLYTFNGSTAKTIDIKAGTNVTLTKSAGSVTINASALGYTLPAATSTALGGVKVSATQQTVSANAVTATAAKTYAVQLDASNNAVVNVPWVDTNTVYTHPTSGVGAGTYRSVTVDTNGHVTNGTNPTTVSGYGLTDVYTKTEITTSLALKVNNSEKGVANGIATLDTNGKVVLTQIPDSVLGQLEYMGTWDFSTIPTATQKGQYWISSVSGNGYIVGDWAVWNGSSFDKVDNTDAVASVAGRTGNVVLTKSDVGLANVDNTADNLKNVLSATKWTTGRTVGITGDITYTSGSFDGTTNVTGAATLASVGTSGTYTKVTTDAKGRVTSGTNPTTIAGYSISDAYTKTEVQTVLPKVGFDTANVTAPSVGQMAWNGTENTVDLGLNGAVLQIGQEQLIRVRNNTASIISNGSAVMATGTIGNSGRIAVAHANLTNTNAKMILGICTEDIAAGADGFVTTFGKVRNLNTTGSQYGETWVDGDVIYVKDLGSGALTKVVPSDTQLKMPIAIIINAHASNGTLFVRVNSIDENHAKSELALKASTTYVDGLVGDINAALDAINGVII